MCGFTGFLDLANGVRRDDLALLEAMTDSLAHRGPDSAGYHHDEWIALGHRRLSIIDVAGGDQPISNEDGSITLVFNGQIYNYLELRRDLESKGHRFKTKSDTEVLVHLYEERGNDLVTALRGMFAFAIWDRPNRKLLLARDRLGIKPLYYRLPSNGDAGEGRVAFGSELKALLQGLDELPPVDPVSLTEFYTFLYVPCPRTIFQGISKLPPATWLEVSPRGVRQETYWDVAFEPRAISVEEAREELVSLVRECVDMRLMSEVPLGAFLSGGTDSTAVVWNMSQLSADPVKTVTVGFGESAFDEREVAREVARASGTDHQEVEVRPDALEALDILSWHFDEPFGDSSMIPTYYVSRAARSRVTVALSGDGGDENFAGYRRYRYDVLENRLRSLFPGPLRAGLGWMGAMYPKADWLPRPLRAKTLLTNLARDPLEAYYRSVAPVLPEIRDRLLSPELRRQVSEEDDPLARFRRIYDGAPARDLLSKIQYLDIKTYLHDDILTKVDRASMAVSLEVRVPLLDHRFVEFAAGLDPSLKLRGGTGKWIFRESYRDKLPPSVIDGTKRGFSIPLRQWMRKDLAEIMNDLVLPDPDPALDGDVLHRLWNEHRTGRADHSTVLYGALVHRLWRKRIVESRAAVPTSSALSGRAR